MKTFARFIMLLNLLALFGLGYGALKSPPNGDDIRILSAVVIFLISNLFTLRFLYRELYGTARTPRSNRLAEWLSLEWQARKASLERRIRENETAKTPLR